MEADKSNGYVSFFPSVIRIRDVSDIRIHISIRGTSAYFFTSASASAFAFVINRTSASAFVVKYISASASALYRGCVDADVLCITQLIDYRVIYRHAESRQVGREKGGEGGAWNRDVSDICMRIRIRGTSAYFFTSASASARMSYFDIRIRICIPILGYMP